MAKSSGNWTLIWAAIATSVVCAGSGQRLAFGQSQAGAKALPATLVQAKTVFLVKEPDQAGRPTAFEFQQLESELRRWDRLEIVDAADSADVTMALATTEVERPAETRQPLGGRLVNPKTAIVRRDVSTVTVRHAATGEILWTGSADSPVLAIRRLQTQMPLGPGPKVCVAVWCW